MALPFRFSDQNFLFICTQLFVFFFFKGTYLHCFGALTGLRATGQNEEEG